MLSLVCTHSTYIDHLMLPFPEKEQIIRLFIVLDVQGDGVCGSVGSYNALYWKSRGTVGIVSNGGIRDTDEIIKDEISVYLDMHN